MTPKEMTVEEYFAHKAKCKENDAQDERVKQLETSMFGALASVPMLLVMVAAILIAAAG